MNVGDVLDNRYQIIKLVGEGRSEVFLAMDSNLKGKVLAVKVIQKTSKDFDSFLQETKLLSKLNHQGIPNITQQIENEKECCVVMNYYNGETLYDFIKKESENTLNGNFTSMSEREKKITEIFKSLCEILIYIHSVYKSNDVDINAPVIHRDIKPENIMLADSGIKLIDWGTAGEFKRGVPDLRPSWGTKAYAAPEQFAAGAKYIDERTDIYALGATMYYALTSVPPGENKKNIRPLTSINPNISEGMGIIIDKCMKYNPEERYQYADEILRDLEHIDNLTKKARNEKRMSLVMFGLSALLCMVGIVLSLVSNNMINIYNSDNFQSKIQLANAQYSDALYYRRQGDIQNAEEALDQAAYYYTQALEYDKTDVETYKMLFTCLLPQGDSSAYDEDTYNEEIINAIDIMRRQYIDEKNSGVYHSDELMYLVAQKCIYVSDNPVYARYAVEYLELIKNNGNYDSSIFSKTEIDSMYLIASSISTAMYSTNIDDFIVQLSELEQENDQSIKSYDDKLDIYLTLIKLYSRYSSYILSTDTDPYDAIIRLGEKSREIIESQSDSENLSFSEVIPMYQMVAEGLYEKAIVNKDADLKREGYQSTLEWLQYLEVLNADMSARLLLKYGNCYRGIYETYVQNDLAGVDNEETLNVSDDVLANLNLAIEKYGQALNSDDNSSGVENTRFSAQIGITICYAYDELRKSPNNRVTNKLQAEYDKTRQMQKENQSMLGISQLSQYQSLTALVKRLGVE